MTREEAANLLSVAVDAPADAVVRQYRRLHADLQIQLMNAPTPSLKATYNKSLLELRDASELLAPNSTRSAAADLPSPEPVVSAVEPLKASRSGLAGAHQYRRPARAGLQTGTIVLGGVAIVLAALLAFAVVRWHQTAVLLKAQQGVGNAQPMQIPNREPRERPASDPVVPVLFKGGGQDCTLYIDGVKSINVPAQALTHASLPAGDHYLECAIFGGVKWKRTVTFSGVGQKIVEIGKFEASLRDALSASMAGAARARIASSGGILYTYGTEACEAPFGGDDLEHAVVRQDLPAGTPVTLAGTQPNSCSEIPIRWNGAKSWVNLDTLVFLDRDGHELAIK